MVVLRNLSFQKWGFTHRTLKPKARRLALFAWGFKMLLVTQNLIGIEGVVKIYGEYPGDVNITVEVKNLTKSQILQLLREEWDGWTPLNATIFYHNETNWEHLKELHKEGKLRWRNCDGFAFELAEGVCRKLKPGG